MKYILIILFLAQNVFAQISGGTQDVNILSGSVTLLGPSSVSQSGTWNINSITNPVAVTGTFFQATQPVSIASSVAVTGPLTDTQLRATAVPVSLASVPTHPVTQSGAWSVGLNAGANAIGSITNTSFASTQSGVWNVGLSTGSNVIGSISNTGFGITGTLPSFGTTQTFNIGTGAFVDRTTAAAPYSQRLTDGTAFYDARQIRALTSSDVVTIANPTSSVSITGTPNVNVTNASIPVTGTFFQATQPVSAASLPLPTGAATEATVNTLLKPANTLAGVTTVGAVTAITNALPTGTNSIGQVTANAGTNLNTSALALEATLIQLRDRHPSVLVNDRMKVEMIPVPNNLGVTAVGTAAQAVTLTMPAVAAQFHYVDSIEIVLYSTAARTGSATPITCTSTNLLGNPAWTWGTAAAIGTTDFRQLYNANRPIRSAAVNTATTIVCPAVTGGLWRMNVAYSTSP